MADPLSVAASVVGLLTAAVQVSTFLYNVIQKSRDAPQSAVRLRNQVDDIHNVLQQLQRFLDGGRPAQRSRTALIMVEQVTATLASCVTTFDDLKTFAEGLQSESKMGLLIRARWVFKEEALRDFQTRLEAQKASMTLMLTILTCQQQNEAEDKVDALRDKVEQIYQMNIMVAQRMLAWDMSQLDRPVALSQKTVDDIGGVTQTRVPAEAPPAYTGTTDATTSLLSPIVDDAHRDRRAFAFEELLMNSRAYRQAARNNSDAFSVMSAAGRTATWSMLSGLSLSEMSNIAILAIPVYATDLNDKESYNFEAAKTDVDQKFAQPRGISLNQQSQKQRREWRDLFKGVKNVIAPLVDPQPVIPDTLGPKVFGVALVESIRYANVAITLIDRKGKPYVYGHVPIIVAKCCSYLKKKAIKTEDVFGHSGHAARVAALQKTFDTPQRYGRVLDWAGYTIADVTGVLLRYLKSLPEPVIPYNHYTDFTAPFRDVPVDPYPEDFPVDETITAFQRLIAALPAINRHLFLYIIDILSVTANHSDDNKMTPARLISIFQPSLLSRPPMDMDSEEHICAANAATFLVNQQRYQKFLDDNGAVAPAKEEPKEDTTTPAKQTADDIIITASPTPMHAQPYVPLTRTNTDLSLDFMGSISLDNAAMIANAEEDENPVHEMSSVVSPIAGCSAATMSAPDVSTTVAAQSGVGASTGNLRSFTLPSSRAVTSGSNEYALRAEAERSATR